MWWWYEDQMMLNQICVYCCGRWCVQTTLKKRENCLSQYWKAENFQIFPRYNSYLFFLNLLTFICFSFFFILLHFIIHSSSQPTLILWGDQDQVFPLELGHRLKRSDFNSLELHLAALITLHHYYKIIKYKLILETKKLLVFIVTILETKKLLISILVFIIDKKFLNWYPISYLSFSYQLSRF